jgi:hypothetical protein
MATAREQAQEWRRKRFAIGGEDNDDEDGA